MGIFTLIDSFDNYELFRNIVIVLVFLFIFMKLTIGLNIILALILGVICVLYLTEKEDIENAIEKKYFDTKYETIKPIPDYFRDDKDIVDWLFSIQDFYVFNPLAYEDMIKNIDLFISLRDILFNNEKFANHYYQIAESKKNNALNSFHSIIFKLPNDRIFTEKFDRAHKRLETILNKHLNEMYDQCNYYIKKHGKDVLKRQINIGPKEYNTYFDKDFTYQIY
ncbi:hypothetical protein QKU48_gp0326 [Fadolivirus algeromassiliense]|jgi:hypothetical protein|uniref:Uncharacterized protein n=1 Tax=Fadolivirus FV1/VV64 TaxID=3070911 RepID=A0A7D3QUR9_9VIRU|nr:hypothetical protein QKU48_gp0326 [Fadolivirus algeromassiliense]QKF93784.1 hypothetical protein Fadolivirus_1_326 [Fadolivirus FV1/VV64]